MRDTGGAPKPNRYVTDLDRAAHRPVHVVWEITLACDLKCGHCGSRAGRKRPHELTTAECLDVVAQLAALGTREITLIGGEAYLRRDFAQIIAAITAAGIECTLQSGGRNLTEERVRAAKAAGLKAAGISIDGLREVHDALRGVPGSFDAAVASLKRLRAHGIPAGANTAITKRSFEQLDAILDVLIDAGAQAWQIALTVPMGRASENWAMMLQPHQMLELMPKLAALQRRAHDHGVLMQPANNIGYFGPYEGRLRGTGLESVHYAGCPGGQNVMGIEADGNVKGCPSLPTDGYVGGNTHEIDLTTIWNTAPQIAFARGESANWGFCKSCYYASVCRAGCTWMSHSMFGKPGENPYCHHRAEELARQGLRESVRQVAAAPGTSFDFGLFEIVVETSDGRPADVVPLDLTPRDAGASGELIVCYSCFRHVFAGTPACPFCAADIAQAQAHHDDAMRAARSAADVLLAALSAT
ncbi:MAG: radical SAM protein [Candidatus Eremiobacteraeota bacterium]|nr:radical SAM protein [Candidatus Eremiobacteraeota bacterium]